MAKVDRSRARYGEAFWRAHHEAWRRSALNQREYCEVQGIPLKAFGNWRAKFKAEPQLPGRKLLYRRGGLSHIVSHKLNHMTSGRLSHRAVEEEMRPIVPPSRGGHRRTFSEDDKRRIIDEATAPDVNLSAVARSYGIAARVLFRWKQELAPPPAFVTVCIEESASSQTS